MVDVLESACQAPCTAVVRCLTLFGRDVLQARHLAESPACAKWGEGRSPQEIWRGRIIKVSRAEHARLVQIEPSPAPRTPSRSLARPTRGRNTS